MAATFSALKSLAAGTGMTIALALKIGDGIVLGADSAGTLTHPGGETNVYNSSEKVFNLVKGLPVGMATYGLGGLNGRSTGTLVRDLRQRLTTGEEAQRLSTEGYTMEQAAHSVKTFFFDELYVTQFGSLIEARREQKARQAANGGALAADEQRLFLPPLGFIVAGYSAGRAKPQIWTVEINNDGEAAIELACDEDLSGVGVWRGMTEALDRLLLGYSVAVYHALVATGVKEEEAMEFLGRIPFTRLIQPAMPLQDAIDLLHYLINVVCGFERFSPGPPAVHRPIDSAAITRHEGFRWVRRKHYYTARLNPPILPVPSDPEPA